MRAGRRPSRASFADGDPDELWTVGGAMVISRLCFVHYLYYKAFQKFRAVIPEALIAEAS